jgi:hypothetical protein
MAYRPKNPSRADEPAGGAQIPFGVRLLALLAGTVFLLLSAKSVRQDYQLYYKLTHLDELYTATPAKWIKLDVRRDASGSDEFYADILFDADVNGTSVWGWRLSLEEIPGDSAYWVSRLAPYRVGDTVTAYVNPQDPKDSFIERKTDGVQRVISKALLGVAFGLFGGTLVVLSLLGFLRRPSGAGPGGKKRK